MQDKRKEVDYQDFVGILVLLLINSTISFIEENNAGNAAAALMARLAPKAKVSFLDKVLDNHILQKFCSAYHLFYTIYVSLSGSA